MAGSAIVRKLLAQGNCIPIVVDRSRLDLTQQKEVEDFFSSEKIDQVYLASGRVGGIYANEIYPSDLISDNLTMDCNIIHSAHRSGVQKLLYLGSSCIYPRGSPQPISEDVLLTGKLEPTNEPYAIAKIAGIKLCESYNRQYGRDYRSVVPTNVYGPNDNFHPKNSHVVPAMIRRFHEAIQDAAKDVVVWGSGKPMRGFLHANDLADACVHVMNLDDAIYHANKQPTMSHINIGTGLDCSIRELAETIARVTGFKGELTFDSSKPDGTPRKHLDISRLKALGWQSSISLEDGLRDTYVWFLANQSGYRQ